MCTTHGFSIYFVITENIIPTAAPSLIALPPSKQEMHVLNVITQLKMKHGFAALP
jgi:hypothetical protein